MIIWVLDAHGVGKSTVVKELVKKLEKTG